MTSREQLLLELPVQIGSEMADAWKAEMARQNRAIEGGWPGTLGEARAQALAYFGRELLARKMPPLNSAEATSVTSLVYAKARQNWLAAVNHPGRRTNKAHK